VDIFSKTGRIWMKLDRDGKWGKSDPVKFSAKLLQNPLEFKKFLSDLKSLLELY